MPELAATPLDALLRALAHPARRQALVLAAAAPVTSCGLARALDLGQSSAWRHLQRLEELGLLYVAGEREREEAGAAAGVGSAGRGLVLAAARLDEGLRDVLAELARVREGIPHEA